MILYVVLQHDIGRKFGIVSAFLIFGTKQIVVELSFLRRQPEIKNSWTASISDPLVMSQEEVKNSIGNPSGPGALLLGIENVVASIRSEMG